MPKNSMLYFQIISMVAILIAVISLAKPYLPKVDATQLLPIESLSTKGYTKVDVDVSSVSDVGIVVVQGGCYRITANTELSQVESIANGKENKIPVRPNIHDVFKDAAQNLEIDVIMVKIVDVRDNNYIGELILRQGNKIVSLDSKPSDDIALAVRTGAPIYVKDDILKSQGEYIC